MHRTEIRRLFRQKSSRKYCNKNLIPILIDNTIKWFSDSRGERNLSSTENLDESNALMLVLLLVRYKHNNC